MRTLAWPVVALVSVAVTGCQLPWSSTPTATDPSVNAGEVATHAGQVCPAELPIDEDPGGHGFGVEDAASELPSLLAPEDAWVCEYRTVDQERTPSGGTTYGWERHGRARAVPAPKLAALPSAFDDLEIPPDEMACNADLGPRWMVVYSHGGDLTGVVVDDYGCRDVRLTDEPFTTPPGASGQTGAVTGVLAGGQAVLDAVGVGRDQP